MEALVQSQGEILPQLVFIKAKAASDAQLKAPLAEKAPQAGKQAIVEQLEQEVREAEAVFLKRKYISSISAAKCKRCSKFGASGPSITTRACGEHTAFGSIQDAIPNNLVSVVLENV